MINALFEAGTWLSLLILWWMFHWPYRQYQIDKARHELFTMRDRLFDSAAEGSCIQFEDRAYGMTRTMLNGMLRTIGDRSFPGMLITSQFFARNQRWKTGYARHEEAFARATGALSSEGRELIQQTLNEANEVITDYMIKTSLLGLVTSSAFRLTGRSLIRNTRKRYAAKINYNSHMLGLRGNTKRAGRTARVVSARDG